MNKWIGLGLLFYIHTIWGLQSILIMDDELAQAKISSNDITRLFVQADRIKNIIGIKGAYIHENDETNGDVYLKVKKNYQNRAFTVLIQTEKNHHFTLLLNPISAPSETIRLIPIENKDQKTESEDEKKFEVQRLMHAMENQIPLSNYLQHSLHSSPLISGNLKIQLLQTYQGTHFYGEIYSLTNLKNYIIHLKETDFYQEKEQIAAIRLSHLSLLPMSYNYLYVVKYYEL